jgi:hypothetical protein
MYIEAFFAFQWIIVVEVSENVYIYPSNWVTHLKA